MRISSLNFPLGLGNPEVFLVYVPFPNKFGEDSIRYVLPATSRNVAHCFPTSANDAIIWCNNLKEEIKDNTLPTWGDCALDEIPYGILSTLKSN